MRANTETSRSSARARAATTMSINRKQSSNTSMSSGGSLMFLLSRRNENIFPSAEKFPQTSRTELEYFELHIKRVRVYDLNLSYDFVEDITHPLLIKLDISRMF